MCLYLTKRGATYYFRRVIPLELRPAFNGAGEFMLSLRTKDKEEAKRLRSVEAVRTDKLIADAEAQLGLRAHSTTSPAVPTRAPTEFELEQAAAEQTELSGKEARREELSGEVAAIRHKLSGPTADLPYELLPYKYAVEEIEFDKQLLQDHLLAATAELQALRDGAAPPPARHENTSPTVAQPLSGEAMLDTTIIDLWAAERKVEPKTKDAHAAVSRWFYARVGRKAVIAITRADIQAFKAALVAEGQSNANVKVKLGRLRTLLQWAADNDYATENVAAGVTIKNAAADRDKRKPFDLPALRAIFASPVYVDGLRPIKGRGEAAYWLPLLALFTGARLEELGQLTPADIVEEAYADAEGHDRKAWVIRIREDAEAGQKLKNAASERRVPVHPELARLGFIRFADVARAAKQTRLFPALKPNFYGRLTAKWGEWWSTYRREICGVTDRRMVFHSFRHTFKDYARHAGIPEGVQRQIMGHSPGDVADEYGSGYSLHQLVEGMARYKVPGLRLLTGDRE